MDTVVAQESQKQETVKIENPATNAETLYGTPAQNAESKETEKAEIETKSEGKIEEGQDAKSDTKTETGNGDNTDTATGIDAELELDLKDGLTQTDIDEVKALAKEYKISKEAAQKILDQRLTVSEKLKQEQSEGLKAAMKSWYDQSHSDPEIGGEKLAKTIEYAKIAVKSANPKLLQVLESSGLGNHPEILRTMAWFGKQMEGDKFQTPGSNPAPKEMDAKYVMYGKD